MSLLQYVKNTIYQASGEEIKTPDAYERFGILIPESASTAQGVRPFPLPDDEHLFALFWNIHDGHKLFFIAKRIWLWKKSSREFVTIMNIPKKSK